MAWPESFCIFHVTIRAIASNYLPRPICKEGLHLTFNILLPFVPITKSNRIHYNAKGPLTSNQTCLLHLHYQVITKSSTKYAKSVEIVLNKN